LLGIMDEELAGIVAAQLVGAVDHEEHPSPLPGCLDLTLDPVQQVVEPKSGSWTVPEVRRAGCPARHKEAQ
jgi:hypothetical protein